MSAGQQPVTLFEIDLDYCSLDYGVGPCTAVLGATGAAKCFNMFKTCQDQENFANSVKTVTYCTPTSSLPKGRTIYPILDPESIRETSSSVNISGTNPNLSATGRVGTLSVTLQDIPDHDRFLDKYQPERISGAAQSSGIGYNPADRSTHLRRLKARWPFYAGRNCRLIKAYVDDDGTLTKVRTHHFSLSDIDGPNANGEFTVKAEDPFGLANRDKAFFPKQNTGTILSDIDKSTLPTFALSPVGVGDLEYPASGLASIGSECVSYTRVADDITLTARELEGTTDAAHRVGDVFQEAEEFINSRVDDALIRIQANGPLDPALIPTAKWEAEITTWASSVLLNTVVMKPTDIGALTKEIAEIGFSIWWDWDLQEVGLLATRPATGGTTHVLNDTQHVKKMVQKDNDKDRLTQVHFLTGQNDISKSLKDQNNYARPHIAISSEAEGPLAFGSPSVRTVFCRWFNVGNQNLVELIAGRLLAKFVEAPKTFLLTVDADLDTISLTDAVNLTIDENTDFTGLAETIPLQVSRIYEPISGHEIELLCQLFEFSAKFGYIMEDTANDWGSATPDELANGAYIVDENTLTFPDGSGPYVII